jgi:hypothetical protein
MDLEAIVVPDFLSDLFACLSSYKQGLIEEAVTSSPPIASAP